MLKVLWVAAEATPYARVGGLADVAGAMPAELQKTGVDARLCLPYYRSAFSVPSKSITVFSVAGHEVVVRQVDPLATHAPTYLIQVDALFDRPQIYGEAGGEYADSALRFAIFSAAAVALADKLGMHVIHAHDWHAALSVRGRPSVLTIHNLAYQGVFEASTVASLALPAQLFDQGHIHFLRIGIEAATVVSTVSPNYAREITTPAGGVGLDVLLARRRPVGILNGIDTDDWNPARDPVLPAAYTVADRSGKERCKRELLSSLGFSSERFDWPLLISIGRLAEQKGLDLLIDALWWHLPRDRVTAVVVGQGETRLHQRLTELAAAHRESMRFIDSFDAGLAHRLMAAGDALLLPSLFEPCGLTQMQAQRYGTVPIARRTGGIVDTVVDASLDGRGTGFLFDEPSASALQAVIWRAISLYRSERAAFARIAANGMAVDFSWGRRATEYVQLYERALASGI